MGRVVFVLFLILFCCKEVNSAERISGVYSNMYYSREGGDVFGMEVILVFSREGYMAVVQYAEGSPSVPVVAKVAMENKKLEVFLPGELFGGENDVLFSGRFVKGGLLGGFQGEKEFYLKKGKSYWQ